MMELPSLSVIQEFVNQFRAPEEVGQTGKGNKILFQGTVVSWDNTTKKVKVKIDGADVNIAPLFNANYTAGQVVWGIKEGNVRIVLGILGYSPLTWYTVGTTGVAYQSGWVAESGRIAQYSSKDANGWVHLRGKMRSGTTGSVAFTLPSGLRPAQDDDFIVMTALGPMQCKVTAAGLVVVYGTTAPSWVTLSGVSFYADGS